MIPLCGGFWQYCCPGFLDFQYLPQRSSLTRSPDYPLVVVVPASIIARFPFSDLPPDP
jgi:hypothetical protein